MYSYISKSCMWHYKKIAAEQIEANVCMQYLLALQLLPLLPGFQQVQSGLGCQGVLGDQQVLRLPVYRIIMMMTIVGRECIL